MEVYNVLTKNFLEKNVKDIHKINMRFQYLMYHSNLESLLNELIKKMYINNIKSFHLTKDMLIPIIKTIQFDNVDYFQEKVFYDYFNYIYTDSFFLNAYIYINSYYTYIISELNEYKNVDVYTVNDLPKLFNSNTYTVSTKFNIDGNLRDYPFIYYNKKLYCHKTIKSHKDICKELLKCTYALSENVRDIQNLFYLDQSKPIIFGSVVKGISIIESYQNIDLNSAFDICLKYWKDVFYYNRMENKMKGRLT